MLPENQIPNTLGLSPQGSASMMGSMGDAVSSAIPPPVIPQDDNLQKVALQFRNAWKTLEDLNGEFGGDADKFFKMQKSLEDWFADIATKLPSSEAPSQQSTY